MLLLRVGLVLALFLMTCTHVLGAEAARQTDEDAKLTRMEKIPDVIATARRTLARCSRVKVETAIMQTEGAIGFYSHEVFQLAGLEVGKGELGRKAAAVVEELKGYLEYLKKEVLPRSTDSWRIGSNRFVKKLDFELDAGISAEEVLADARREADKVESEMSVIARQLWGTLFPGMTIPADEVEGRRELIRRVLDALAADHSEVGSLVSDVRATAVAIKAFITAQDHSSSGTRPVPDH